MATATARACYKKTLMKREKTFKYLSFTIIAIITVILMTATVMEKLYGTTYAVENIYCADWMIALWGTGALSAIVYMLQRKLHRQPATLCLHIAFAVILAGALVTHTKGRQGQLHLRVGEYSNLYALPDGEIERLPFSISLHGFEVVRYAERQFFSPAVGQCVKVAVFAHTQVQLSLLARGVRDKCPGQNNSKGNVQAQRSRLPVQFALQQINDGRQRACTPQRNHPVGAVYILYCIGCAVQFLHNGGRHEHHRYYGKKGE